MSSTVHTHMSKPPIPLPTGFSQAPQYELRFQSLFHSGRALTFPCNAQGDVLMDDLSSRALENYLFARAVVGHEYANPVVLACD